MRRREFLKAVGGSVMWPFAARAEQRIPRIGYLGPEPAETDGEQIAAFREGMRDLGYIDGKSVEIETRWPKRGVERLKELASELVNLEVEVIVTGGPGVFEAHKATQTIPIVAGVTGDLVSLGLAESLGHPGHNVTGQTFFAPQLIVKRVELLKRVHPSMTKLGLFVLRGALTIPTYLRALESPARSMGLTMELLEANSVGECESALATGPGAGIDALVLTDFPLFVHGPAPAAIGALAAHRGLPSAGHLTFARSGGLIAYGVDLPSKYRSASRFVDQILKGAKTGDIPIEQATRFTTIFNLNTAAALGVKIPADLLAGADEVIE